MSNKIKITKLGFTVIELIIVISIVGIVAAASFVMFDEARNKAVLQNAQASVINALEQARSRAATGVGTIGTNHGVIIDVAGRQIINFRNDGSGTTTDATTTLPANISIIGSNQEITFNRLSATSSDFTITIENTITGDATTVSVTENGIIRK